MARMVMIGILLFNACLLSACDAKDRCLDDGGSYDEITKECKK